MLDADSRTIVWTSSAFAIALAAALGALAALGVRKGIPVGLMATGRIAFAYFCLAYVGGPLTTLFGAAFAPLRRRGRDLGLAFAAVILVHLGLVATLCIRGDPPGVAVFLVFGPAATFTVLLTLLSFPRFRMRLPEKLWPPLMTVATTYILLAFLRDFVRLSPPHSVGQLIAYGPFAAAAILSLLLKLAALAKRLGVPALLPRSSLRPR